MLVNLSFDSATSVLFWAESSSSRHPQITGVKKSGRSLKTAYSCLIGTIVAPSIPQSQRVHSNFS